MVSLPSPTLSFEEWKKALASTCQGFFFKRNWRKIGIKRRTHRPPLSARSTPHKRTAPGRGRAYPGPSQRKSLSVSKVSLRV
jgi:hypothetical protein